MSTRGYDARSPLASPLLPKGEASAKGEDSLTLLYQTLRVACFPVGVRYRRRNFIYNIFSGKYLVLI
ncbi:MAG: hypothetical protein V7K92_23160 [Nostoc sp.]